MDGAPVASGSAPHCAAVDLIAAPCEPVCTDRPEEPLETCKLCPGLTHPKLFLDLFAGAKQPLSVAMAKRNSDRFEAVDLIFGPAFDLLDDVHFEALCGLASSGLVGAAAVAPVCSEFSPLKLLPQGPNAVRAPWALDGFPDNDWRATLAVQESQLLHDRARELLSRVAAAGGCIMLENPLVP